VDTGTKETFEDDFIEEEYSPLDAVNPTQSTLTPTPQTQTNYNPITYSKCWFVQLFPGHSPRTPNQP